MTLRAYSEPAIDFSTFPDSDGEPMADNEINQDQMIYLILILRRVLGTIGHHVGGNLLIYYNPLSGLDHISPDVFVALDAGPADRRSWKVWEEGKFPEVVFEIASPSTNDRDIGPKVLLYERLGAREYYIFDPAGDLQPAFRGYARRGTRLLPLAVLDGTSVVSPLLGLELRVVDDRLRVIDAASSKPYPEPAEEYDLRRQAEAHAAQEARAREEAESALAAALNEIARLRGAQSKNG